jgi:hypothetical protein
VLSVNFGEVHLFPLFCERTFFANILEPNTVFFCYIEKTKVRGVWRLKWTSVVWKWRGIWGERGIIPGDG